MTLFVRFQVLLLSALAAHELAGGSLIQTSNFLWQGLGIGIALFCIRNIKLEGPTLALLILFIQSTGHFLLGEGSYVVIASLFACAALPSMVMAWREKDI